MRYEIDYEMDYRYRSPVEDNANALRVAPATSNGQRCEDFSFVVKPNTRVAERRDWFGTRVHEFTVTKPHRRLHVKAEAHVTVSAPEPPPDGDWEVAKSKPYREEAAEFLLDAEPEPSHPEFAELLEEIEADSPLGTARKLVQVVAGRFEYQPGATYVGSTVHDLLSGGAGVCQDFAHLSLHLLRSCGLGARYVSGYVFVPAAEGGDTSAELATHAWVEVLIPGDQPKWIGIDPTNRDLVGDAHVKIGHGRNYRDLPPIRGVYRGPVGSDVDAHVLMRRAAEQN